MEDASSLEAYLREAPIDLYGHFEVTGGGGHPGKQLVVVRGGIGALAKLAHNEAEQRQCQSEVGAFVLADALGWGDLVPVTVFRSVPTPEGIIDASVQILWPAFMTAAELGLNETMIEDRDALRAAVFDALLLNSDRHAGNWELVARTKLALIDHGHTALSGLPGWSGFAQARRGEEITGELGERLENLVDDGVERLAEIVGETEATAVVERATTMLAGGAVAVDA
jgi:hypothetical protein